MAYDFVRKRQIFLQRGCQYGVIMAQHKPSVQKHAEQRQ
jgi:hypothetical protein